MDQENLAFVELAEDMREAYLDYAREFRSAGEPDFGENLRQAEADWPAFVRQRLDMAAGRNLPDGAVPQIDHCLMRDKRILGDCNLRVRLNEVFTVIGGHIDYGVRPSERGKGYATLMLKQALDKARGLGPSRVLLTCEKANVPSARVIQKNGGVLENEVISPRTGNFEQRYWIDLGPVRREETTTMHDWQRIRYPAPLRPGDAVGITAPSSGVIPAVYPRLELCIQNLRQLGYRVIEGECLRQDHKHVSGPREDRVRDLLSLWKNPEVRAIIPPWGGELAIHLLPCIDFAELAAAKPNWLLGYSDTSTLSFAITMVTGVATAHGPNLLEIIPNQAGELSQRWREVLSTGPGGRVTMNSALAYQVQYRDWKSDPTAQFNLAEPTRWRCMLRSRDVDSLSFRGRIVGGCLEILSSLVGTPYGDLPRFRHRVGENGLILFLENAESSPPNVCRMLWQLRLAGWFDGLAGLLLGRSNGPEAAEFTYMDALHDALDDLAIPIINDADIGHRPPQMTIINGAIASVASSGGAGSVELLLA